VSEVRTFTTFTGDVERPADWLAHVVMGTGCSSRHALVAKWEKRKRPIGRGSAC
jgi:hypothetical protein